MGSVALADLVQKDVATRLGPVRLWIAPEPPGSTKPIVLAIPGILAPVEEIAKLGEGFGILATLAIVRLPSASDAALSDGSLDALSRAVGEVIETVFAGRRVVLLGVSIGAVAALGVRASNLARVVAVEPTLASGKLWPLLDPLRAHLRQTADAVSKAFVFEMFGIDGFHAVSRDHGAVLDGVEVPVEVVLGETPLAPERPLARFPSFVAEEERRMLGDRPGVKLHLVRGTGHNVVGQAPRAMRDILLEAARRASVDAPAGERGLDEPLLEATPLVARDVLHWGPGGAGFAQAFGRANPQARVVALGDDPAAVPPAGPEGGFEAVVASVPPPADLLGRLAGALAFGGHLIARGMSGGPHDLAAHGLSPRGPTDAGGTGVSRAQKLPPGVAPRAPLHLHSIVYAGLLMDIRTRLPARGLASDPDLEVVFETAPFELPPLGREVPKVVVLQRPAELRPEAWRPFLARAIREDWIVVMEYDDYPPLVAEVQGRPHSEADMLRFAFVHAVQTSAPPLVELFRPYNPEIAHFPNAAFELLPFPQGPRPRRVFYGAVIRGRYAIEVARSLGPAIAQAPDTEFVVIGDPQVFKALPTSAKRYYEYMSFEGYLELMSQCAVSLSPIEALPMRETKSDAKFVDAARAGVLTIASPTIYDRVIEHGVNGFLAPEVADWAPLLGQALTDEPLRARLARRAWEYVRDERMFAQQVGRRRDWYFDLWSRREALHEALMRRTPGLREAVAGG